MSDAEFYGAIIIAGFAAAVGVLALFKLDEKLLARRRRRRGGDITSFFSERP